MRTIARAAAEYDLAEIRAYNKMAKELASQKGWFSAITGSGKPTTESPQTAGKLVELSESDWKKVGESVINLYSEKLSDLEETKNVRHPKH